MFVVNFKLDIKRIFIICIFLAAAIGLIVEFGYNRETIASSNKVEKYDYVLDESNFTTALKTIHENIDNNLSKTVKITGFVYRMDDFKEDFFVCGRNIVVNNEDNVAGILCQSKESSKLLDNEWVEVTGIITKGNYNGDTAVLKIGSIKKVTAPANTFVQ